jgi:lipopolysaccharide/colanic/teichoic acid biosynthesis glycosyltransferase
MEDSKLNIIHKTSNLNNILKNFLDIFILLLFSPIFIALLIFFSLLVFIIDGAPIFYSQTRVGLNGRFFKIFKFRTMKNLKLTKEELDEINERDKIVFKSKNDPRVTRLGTFLRRSSVDELPQLINIFKNEMSFIGPRPPIPTEVLKYEPKHLKRVSVKPGITGLWQVTLRQDNDFDRWVEKDIEYIENWSLILDLKIIFKTFREIFKLTGD